MNPNSEMKTNDLFDQQSDGTKKTYRCKLSDCGKEFRYKSEIIRHTATHTNTRPFSCNFPGCEKGFKRADALDNHSRIHTKEFPFKCEISACEKKFPTKASLRYHILKHKNERSFRCQFEGCDKSFITSFQLKQHEKAQGCHEKLKCPTETKSKPISNVEIKSFPQKLDSSFPSLHFSNQIFNPSNLFSDQLLLGLALSNRNEDNKNDLLKVSQLLSFMKQNRFADSQFPIISHPNDVNGILFHTKNTGLNQNAEN